MEIKAQPSDVATYLEKFLQRDYEAISDTMRRLNSVMELGPEFLKRLESAVS